MQEAIVGDLFLHRHLETGIILMAVDAVRLDPIEVLRRAQGEARGDHGGEPVNVR
jgi:hypothetical protein